MNEIAKSGLPLEQISLIKRQIAKGATDDELKLFLHICEVTGLDPFLRQIYCIKRWDYDPELKQKVAKMTPQISIDGQRLVAERSGKYAGQLGPLWCGMDGKWSDFWKGDATPEAAKVGILRSDFKEPLWAVAHFNEYAQRKQTGELTKMWHEKPALMLAKVAEALALRKAFPQHLSGLYVKEEMPDVKDVTPPPEEDPKKNLTPPSASPASPQTEISSVSTSVTYPTTTSLDPPPPNEPPPINDFLEPLEEKKRLDYKQLQKIYGTANEAKWSNDDIHASIKQYLSIDSLHDLPIDKVDSFCSYMLKNRKTTPPHG
jgi:phage recombination protein Bet